MIKVIELFAGIGGFHVASNELGLDTIWANDLCKNACKVYGNIFGCDSIIEGDIKTLKKEVPDHDLLTAGFPCQPFSSAGKKKGIQDTRGTLFEDIIDILNKKKPKYFVLENVKRLISMNQGHHFATILSALAKLDYLIEWRVVNAADLGLAQNRERIVITGRRLDTLKTNSPSENIILLGKSEMSELSSKKLESIKNPDEWLPILEHKASFSKWGIAQGRNFIDNTFTEFSDKKNTVKLTEVLQKNVGDVFDLTESTKLRMGDNKIVNKFVNGVEIVSNQRGGARMGYTIFGTKGLSPTLTASTSRHYERYKVESRFRRLTNIEYARLQGFPDSHCNAVSLRHQYVLYGNAIPPQIAKWAIEKTLYGKAVKFPESKTPKLNFNKND